LGLWSGNCLPAHDAKIVKHVEELIISAEDFSDTNSSKVIKIQTDANGNFHVESMQTVVMPKNLSKIFAKYNDDVFNDELEEEDRLKRACDVVSYFFIINSFKPRDSPSQFDLKKTRFK